MAAYRPFPQNHARYKHLRVVLLHRTHNYGILAAAKSLSHVQIRRMQTKEKAGPKDRLFLWYSIIEQVRSLFLTYRSSTAA
jgi:hypothetical protein